MADPIPSPRPPAIPGHTLLRRIGQGSYGEVWLARSQTGAFRAVKVVHRSTFEHDRPFERELSGMQKFEPVSRSHPSQVSILQVGVNRPEGYFYYAMELADDGSKGGMNGAEEEGSVRAVSEETIATYQPRTLRQELERHGRLPPARCIEIGLALATALDHLHQHGLIHRDIKPSNVIFVDGVPKLADIGLVTDVGATISHVGTEGFLPPEGPGTARADIYSLGKVLYEICTGRDRMDFPELPTLLGEPREREQLLELNQIFLQACQNDPRKRHASAHELFADLTLLQAGKSVRRARARRERLARARISAIAVAAVIAISGAVHYLYDRRQLQESRRAVELEARARRAADRATRETGRRLADLAVATGERLSLERDPAGALLWFVRGWLDEPAPPDPARIAARRRQIEQAWTQCQVPVVWLPGEAPLQGFTLAADGRRLVLFGPALAPEVWDTTAGRRVGEPLGSVPSVTDVKLSLDGQEALTLTGAGVAQFWTELGRRPAGFPLEPSTPLEHVAFSPGGRQILGTSKGKEVFVWETGSRQLRYVLRHQDGVRAAGFGPDGRWVASLDASGVVQAWRMENGEVLTNTILTLPDPVGLSFHPDNRRVAAWGGHRVRVWDRVSGQWSALSAVHDGPVRQASFSPDGRFLLTVGDDQAVRLWDLAGGHAHRSPWLQTEPVRGAEFSPDGEFVAIASGHHVRLEPLAKGREAPAGRAPVLLTFAREVADIRFDPAGRVLLVAGREGVIRGVEVGRPESRAPKPMPSSPEAWQRWAELLSGREIAPNGSTTPLPAARVRELLSQIHGESPVPETAREQAEWHQRQAEFAEAEHHWFSAGFHWGRAARCVPEENLFRLRVEQAGEALAREEAMASRPPELIRRIPPRPGEADAHLIDLSAHYNAMLDENWLPSSGVAAGNDLSELPRGMRRFGATVFDVRGLIQLSGAALESAGGRFPKEVRGIAVNQRFRRLHLLHGAGWSALSGTAIATYRVHYADGTHQDIRIRFGHHLREWWSPSTATALATSAAVAWEGGNPASRAVGMKVRLYQMTWMNPSPETVVTTMDLISAMENPAPFVLAITTE